MAIIPEDSSSLPEAKPMIATPLSPTTATMHLRADMEVLVVEMFEEAVL